MLDKSLVMKKAGPLPVWAWMGLALGMALAFSTWSKNKTNSKKQQQPPPDSASGNSYPDSVMTPQYTFIDADTTLITNKYEPPGGGRPPEPPKMPPGPPRPGEHPRTPPPPPPPPKPVPPPSPQPAPAPSGVWETVVKWSKGQPKGTPSTLWGIAEKNYGNGGNWGAIWNAPQNAGLRNSRKAPEKIQPGDRVWVPK